MCIKFKTEEISTTGEDNSKSNSKEKEVRLFALRTDEAIWRKRYIDCQQREAKRSQNRGFVTDCNRCE